MSRIAFGGYELLERIGDGGMAEVFRARVRGHHGFAKIVAIKRIRPQYAGDRDFIAMFIDEANIAVRLNHANIAKIYDLGRVGDQYYIAMEHVHGRDLKTIFTRCAKTRGPMPIPEACYVAMKLCDGLDYAHARRDLHGESLQLVHRDISLHNVLLSFDGEVKIIDFGVAKALGRMSRTRTGTIKGKLAYMSPEQMRGLPVDGRSDIFAAGIVMYEMLAGRRLFMSKSPRETIQRIRSGKVVPLRTYNQRIPAALERIVLKALSVHPDDRFQTAGALGNELHRFAFFHRQQCSRSRIASWLRAEFHTELVDENARLDRFKAIQPTPLPGPLPQADDAAPEPEVVATKVGWAPAPNRAGVCYR